MATDSILATDGYKFRMAQAGWPLRRETFYYSHRKGGWQCLPVDIKSFVEGLLPVPTAKDYEYLDKNTYGMSAAFRDAMLSEDIEVNGIPKGAYFFNREPVFSVTGPSALVSWLEPLILQLNYRIQVATRAKTCVPGAGISVNAFNLTPCVVTCAEQRDIVLETLDSIGSPAPKIKVDEAGYFNQVLGRCQALVEAVGAERVFEVGMRGVTCMGQHEIALEACKEAGITRTSNVFLAEKLGMTPVGTMGHEHVQRYGNDRDAYMAMHERAPYPCSFLLDTFDTMNSGIPEAFRIIEENPERGHSIRYDSGDKMLQYIYAVTKARSMGIEPTHILMDGMKLEDAKAFEKMRVNLNAPAEKQLYGFGSHIVAHETEQTLSRNTVAAVWKVSQTGDKPTMKFADEAGGGKESIPGKPIIFRNLRTEAATADLPVGVIAQEGEDIPAGYVKLTGEHGDWSSLAPKKDTIAHSPKTAELITALRNR